MTTTIELKRTDLTAYETNALHQTEVKVREHAFAVGAFVTRYGRQEVLMEAANLFMALHDDLVADADIRTGALDYGMFMAEFGMNDYHASQSHRLQEEFLVSLYRAVIAERNTKAGA